MAPHREPGSRRRSKRLVMLEPLRARGFTSCHSLTPIICTAI
jgi:hypothetical protein